MRCWRRGSRASTSVRSNIGSRRILRSVGLEITDANLLRCEYSDGTEPMVLHHIQRKPWLSPMPSNAYSRLLTRLLVTPDLPLRVPPATIPLRLRDGKLASIDRRWISVRDAVTQRRRSLGIRRRSPTDSS